MNHQVALVINGSQGAGTEICRQLFAKGSQVIATYGGNDNHEVAKQWQTEQKEAGYDIHLAFLEITDIESTCKLINQIETTYHSIDILINNTDIHAELVAEKPDMDAWQATLKTHLSGIFNITHHVIQGMIRRNYGRIINISFLEQQTNQNELSNYSISAGLHGFTKCLAQEIAPFGITVNTISSGYIDTSILATTKDIAEKNEKSAIVELFNKPEEVARVVCFLAEKASNFITASNLHIFDNKRYRTT